MTTNTAPTAAHRRRSPSSDPPDALSHLGPDLVFVIARHLSARDLLALGSVNTHWRQFTRTHALLWQGVCRRHGVDMREWAQTKVEREADALKTQAAEWAATMDDLLGVGDFAAAEQRVVPEQEERATDYLNAYKAHLELQQNWANQLGHERLHPVPVHRLHKLAIDPADDVVLATSGDEGCLLVINKYTGQTLTRVPGINPRARLEAGAGYAVTSSLPRQTWGRHHSEGILEFVGRPDKPLSSASEEATWYLPLGELKVWRMPSATERLRERVRNGRGHFGATRNAFRDPLPLEYHCTITDLAHCQAMSVSYDRRRAQGVLIAVAREAVHLVYLEDGQRETFAITGLDDNASWPDHADRHDLNPELVWDVKLEDEFVFVVNTVQMHVYDRKTMERIVAFPDPHAPHHTAEAAYGAGYPRSYMDEPDSDFETSRETSSEHEDESGNELHGDHLGDTASLHAVSPEPATSDAEPDHQSEVEEQGAGEELISDAAASDSGGDESVLENDDDGADADVENDEDWADGDSDAGSEAEDGEDRDGGSEAEDGEDVAMDDDSGATDAGLDDDSAAETSDEDRFWDNPEEDIDVYGDARRYDDRNGWNQTSKVRLTGYRRGWLRFKDAVHNSYGCHDGSMEPRLRDVCFTTNDLVLRGALGAVFIMRDYRRVLRQAAATTVSQRVALLASNTLVLPIRTGIEVCHTHGDRIIMGALNVCTLVLDANDLPTLPLPPTPAVHSLIGPQTRAQDAKPPKLARPPVIPGFLLLVSHLEDLAETASLVVDARAVYLADWERTPRLEDKKWRHEWAMEELFEAEQEGNWPYHVKGCWAAVKRWVYRPEDTVGIPN